MKDFSLSDISDNIFNDVRNIQIKFKNGDELFISSRNFFGFDLHIVRAIVVEDSVCDKTYQFDSGYIDIDKSFLQQVLGDKVIDKLFNNGVIVSLKVECNDEFKITSDFPFILFTFDERFNNALEYEENDDSIVLRWESAEISTNQS